MKEYALDEFDVDLLKKHISNYILVNNKKYMAEGFSMWLDNCFLGIEYNHHIYKVTIIKEGVKRYWYLKPYDKSFYIMPEMLIVSNWLFMQSKKMI